MNMGTIENIAHGAAHRAIYDHRAQFEATLTTEVEDTFTLLTVTPDNDSCGIFEVTVVGRDSISANTLGKQIAWFEKTSGGVLTISSPQDILTPVFESAATFSITASGGSILVQVSTILSDTNWKAKYDLLTVSTPTI